MARTGSGSETPRRRWWLDVASAGILGSMRASPPAQDLADVLAPAKGDIDSPRPLGKATHETRPLTQDETRRLWKLARASRLLGRALGTLVTAFVLFFMGAFAFQFVSDPEESLWTMLVNGFAWVTMGAGAILALTVVFSPLAMVRGLVRLSRDISAGRAQRTRGPLSRHATGPRYLFLVGDFRSSSPTRGSSNSSRTGRI